MSVENPYLAMDKGEAPEADQLFPYITDKNAQIPAEYFHVTLHRNERVRSHTVYLDPAFTVDYSDPHSDLPHVKYTMTEASITLIRKDAYGPGGDQKASATALSIVGNNNSPEYFEEYIRAIHNDPKLRLVHILAAKEQLGAAFLIFEWLSPDSPIYDLHAE